MRRRRRWLGALALGCAVAAAPAAEAPASGPAAAQGCPGTGVTFRAATPDHAADICSGARAAIGFFTALGLRTDGELRIDVVPEMPERVHAAASGCYLRREGLILLLAYSSFAKQKTWFGVPVDRRLYRSVASHEVAHALAACNFAVAEPALPAMEYVAHVAMFATMDEAQQRMALAAHPGEGFEHEAQISSITYLFDPMRFGAEAYRHYLRPGNGAPFLREVLGGRAIVE